MPFAYTCILVQNRLNKCDVGDSDFLIARFPVSNPDGRIRAHEALSAFGSIDKRSSSLRKQ